MRRDRSQPSWEHTARRVLAAALLLGLVAVGVATGLRAFLARERPDAGNPYEVDMARYKAVDPALVAYVEEGSFPVPLQTLRSLAVDGEDRILVGGDGDGPAILRFDPGGRLLERMTLAGPPHALASGGAGEIYIGFKDHVAVLRPGEDEPEDWTSMGENSFITSVAADQKGVFAADGGQRVVWSFDLDGKLKVILGKADDMTCEEGFLVPGPCFDVALGPGGELWIVDPGRHRVQQRRRDGGVVGSWGYYGFAIDGFSG